MEIPLKTQAISLIMAYTDGRTKDVIRILETIRDCYAVSTKFGLPQGETESTVNDKLIVYNEIDSFIQGLKN